MFWLFLFFICFFFFYPFHFFPVSQMCVTPLYYFCTLIRSTNHLYIIFSYFCKLSLIWVLDRVSWNSAQKIPPDTLSIFRLNCRVHKIPECDQSMDHRGISRRSQTGGPSESLILVPSGSKLKNGTLIPP